MQLSKTESQIFDLLIEVAKHYNTGTTLRVAGGWVRDKLLHTASKNSALDIDIALDNLYGKEFAEHVNKYISLLSKQNKYSSTGHKLEKNHFAVIKANPEQSKHLETATTKIYGQSIDFVNLRTEEYALDADHRIPTNIVSTEKMILTCFRR